MILMSKARPETFSLFCSQALLQDSTLYFGGFIYGLLGAFRLLQLVK